MGRPLNKKFFANREYGSASSSADDGLGGQSVSGISVGTAGTYTSAPTLTFPAPALATEGAVTATATPTFSVVSATISGGTGYGNAQTFNLTVNTAAGSAVLNVTSTAGGAITTVNSVTTAGVFTGISAVTSVSGGTGTGATPVLTYGLLGATVTEQGSGYLPATVGTAVITGSTATVTATITATIAASIMTVTVTDSVLTTGMIVSGGTISSGAMIVNQLTGTTGSTGTYTLEKVSTGAAVTGNNPTTATSNFINVNTTTDTMYGMKITPASSVGGLTGSTTYYIVTNNHPTRIQVATTMANAAAGTTVSTSATSAQSVNAPFGQNLTVTVSAGSGAATATLTSADTVNPGAIQMAAFLATADGGKATRQNSDIIKQVSTTRYRIENQDGSGIVQLTNGSIAAGQGVITVTDYTGSTYYVTKLTARKVTLSRKATAGAGYEFAEGACVPWTLGSAVTGYSVKIDNE
jgi:hypothetical protein